jgi:hypothetical protein
MGGRSDTEFWRHMLQPEVRTELTQEILDISKHRVPTAKDFRNSEGSAGYDIWAFVLTGIGVITPELCKKELETFPAFINKTEIKKYQELVINGRRNNLTYQDFIKLMKEKYNANTIYSRRTI